MFLLGGEWEENGEKPMTSTIRAVVFFLVSVSLLVVYGIQQNKFTTIIGMWIVVTIIGTLIAASKSSQLIADSVVLLMGMSTGMVLGNTTIKLI